MEAFFSMSQPAMHDYLTGIVVSYFTLEFVYRMYQYIVIF